MAQDGTPKGEDAGVGASGVTRTPASLTGTALSENLPIAEWVKRGSLPFTSEAQRKEKPRAPKTVESLVVPSTFGQTAGVGSNDLAAAVAAVPFLGNTLGTGTVHFPPLSVEQYASFCGEVATYPERIDAIRQRYRVPSTPSHQALDAHWQKTLADPRERARFEQGFATYTAWLRKHGWPLPPASK